MGSWYALGVALGLGVAVGVALAAGLVRLRAGVAIATLLAAIAGAVIGWLIEQPLGLLGGLAAVGGVFGAAQLAQGTLRRGGTSGATTLMIGAAALVVAALAFIPGVGYLLALLLPLLGLRLRRRASERYAGLRTLARD